MESSYFDKALQNFMHDIANGGAIRHLADLGLTAEEIAERLDFSMPVEAVGKEMWAYFLENDTIRLHAEEKTDVYRVIKEQTKYGKTTFRRVPKDMVKKEDEGNEPYIPCDFGIRLRHDREAFARELREKLEPKDVSYILGLPWEDRIVYHRPDERIRRIRRKLSEENVS